MIAPVRTKELRAAIENARLRINLVRIRAVQARISSTASGTLYAVYDDAAPDVYDVEDAVRTGALALVRRGWQGYDDAVLYQRRTVADEIRALAASLRRAAVYCDARSIAQTRWAQFDADRNACCALGALAVERLHAERITSDLLRDGVSIIAQTRKTHAALMYSFAAVTRVLDDTFDEHLYLPITLSEIVAALNDERGFSTREIAVWLDQYALTLDDAFETIDEARYL